MAIAEPAITNDPLRGVAAVLERASNPLGRHFSCKGPSLGVFANALVVLFYEHGEKSPCGACGMVVGRKCGEQEGEGPKATVEGGREDVLMTGDWKGRTKEKKKKKKKGIQTDCTYI